MKKTLVSALTTALVVGAASTTFAASNPFSDVPAGHWAYDAVAQLAADGVVEGYGDGTYQGDKTITRYEMAQMVAKAMAKNPRGTDKALVDKLAAEFSDELNNLGVRVANLERNADMVKWNGKAEYTIARHVVEHSAADDHTDNFLFRLEPSAEVNSNWHVNARLDANVNAAKDEGDDGDVKLKRIWAQGDYDNFSVKLGKFAPIDDDSVFDTTFSGAEVSFGNKVKGVIGGGRLHNNSEEPFGGLLAGAKASNYYYAGVNYANDKLMGGVDFHHMSFRDLPGTNNYREWLVKGSYRFDKNTMLGGYYAKSNVDDYSDKSASVEFDYKGAEQENQGTWGAWVAYRHLGLGATPFSTFDALQANEKGWEIGGNYTFFKNIVGTLRYGNGKKINGNNDVHTYFGRVEFLF